MKVLIISHNPITTYQNMGKTMLSLFSDFKENELCQFYIYPTLPNIDKCNSYYRITDKDILKSLPLKVVRGGCIAKECIAPTHSLFEKAGDQAVYKTKHNHNPFLMLARDIMWRIARWWTKDFAAWIEQEKPQVIFVAPGRGSFIYDIARKISTKYGIPIVTYICDDYYFVKNSSFSSSIYTRHLQRNMDRLMKQTALIVGICDEISHTYSEKFGVPAITVMTGSSFAVETEPKLRREPSVITYFGNIRCNRYISLLEIGRTLDQINMQYGVDYRLKIYTAESDPSILQALQKVNSIELCGYVSGEAYEKAFHNAEILLHVEAFDTESIDKVRHSISTKIADSLASGIPLFAYGPEEVASMRYLLHIGGAVVCRDQNALEKDLRMLFGDEAIRNHAVKNALAAARKYHDHLANSHLLYKKTESLLSQENLFGLL